MKIQISLDMVERARQAETEIEGTGLFKTPNYTNLSEPNRFVVGYIGEFAVGKMLLSANRKYRHNVITNGKSQPAEFLVSVHGLRKRLEVKTASKPWYQKMMFPVSQKIDADFLIAVRLNLDEQFAEVMGYLRVSEFSSRLKESVVRSGGPLTRHCEYTDLRPAQEFIELVDYMPIYEPASAA